MRDAPRQRSPSPLISPALAVRPIRHGVAKHEDVLLGAVHGAAHARDPLPLEAGRRADVDAVMVQQPSVERPGGLLPLHTRKHHVGHGREAAEAAKAAGAPQLGEVCPSKHCQGALVGVDQLVPTRCLTEAQRPGKREDGCVVAGAVVLKVVRQPVAGGRVGLREQAGEGGGDCRQQAVVDKYIKAQPLAA
eukprot:CAMPEP_0117696866 /NCGR_PEP_ID=MMETSP0804-20121206/28904_2 /TAXON_ID=1074897 /ORGANISM="Tetraselmis astigmatica, Strain CCMP880" /LENGTH=190 /DNA_ID=CAMNT_0005511039 /DNA_START=548 /DNA_END=1122 /DNA_ORIENTATION=-